MSEVETAPVAMSVLQSPIGVTSPPSIPAAPAPAPRPVAAKKQTFDSLTPPCNLTCPAGENVREWLFYAQAGRFEGAWRSIMKNNPLPAVHGRVCYHPCESGCNRKHFDEAVSIHCVERFVGDMAIEKGWSIEPGPATGKSVLIIGSGPCGLSAAYHLALLGHKVTLYEAAEKLGGMLRCAIPEYRLPRNVLDAEIARIARMGVEFKTSAKVDDLHQTMQQGGYDAVLMAVGAGLSKRIQIPAADATPIIDALQFLANPSERLPHVTGRSVAVYGGGNTAMDAARTALRLGAKESLIIYRRNQARMPAHKSELDEALMEGVKVHWLRAITQVGRGTIEVEVQELDAKGAARPTGKFETLNADLLIFALGQETEVGFLRNVPGLKIGQGGEVEVNDQHMTGCPGLFAGGDMIPSKKTVTTAVGHGKKIARCIDAFLVGAQYQTTPIPPAARFDRLSLEQYPKHPQALQPVLAGAERLSSFAETVGGIGEEAAVGEAKRCFSCGDYLIHSASKAS
jgi:NADPH-dependent glutamate synthase beta subunit-like oxidoreductase